MVREALDGAFRDIDSPVFTGFRLHNFHLQGIRDGLRGRAGPCRTSVGKEVSEACDIDPHEFQPGGQIRVVHFPRFMSSGAVRLRLIVSPSAQVVDRNPQG